MRGFWETRSFDKLSMTQLRFILPLFTRDELREMAREHGIRQGKLKQDLVDNLAFNKWKMRDYIIEIQIY